MVKARLLSLCVLLASLLAAAPGYAQPAVVQPLKPRGGIRVAVDAGIGLPGNVTAFGEPVTGEAWIATLAFEYQGAIAQWLLYRTALEGMVIARSGSVGSQHYKARTLRAGVEGLVGKEVYPRLSVLAGLNMRNDRGVDALDAREPGNIRYELRMVAAYMFSSRLNFEATAAHGWNESTNVTYFQDPRHHIRLGLAYQITGRR